MFCHPNKLTILFRQIQIYTIAKNKFYLNLLQLDHFHIINIHLLLTDDKSLSIVINKQLFSLYINETGRLV